MDGAVESDGRQVYIAFARGVLYIYGQGFVECPNKRGGHLMKTKNLARFAILTALALVLGYVEFLIPIAPAVPGIKLGLGNTVLLYAVYMATPVESALLMFCKVFLSSLLFGGGFSAMLYSLAGGILSLAVMLILVRVPKIGVIGVSACGAICHNIGQIAMASLMLGVGAVWAYFPVLVLSGLVMGPATGLVAKSVFSALGRGGAVFTVEPRPFKDSKVIDIAIISVMLVVSGVVWWSMSRSGLTINEADSAVDAGNYYVEVVQNNEVLYEIPLTARGAYTVKNERTGGENTFVIDESGVHMDHASCPDKVCVNQGEISPGGIVPIACLPNLLSLQVIEKSGIPEAFDMAGQNYAEILAKD